VNKLPFYIEDINFHLFHLASLTSAEVIASC